MDAFLEGLTSWDPKMKTTGLVEPDMVSITKGTYLEAADALNDLFARNLWCDSLPITPPDEERVDWLLAGTEIDPDEQLGTVWPRGGIVKVRDVAIALCMAGGRPEYLPLTIAAVKTIIDLRAGMQSWNSTTCSVFPAFVVNGPAAREIRLGSGYGMLDPDPTHPAGGTIDRAIRLIQQNIVTVTFINSMVNVLYDFGGIDANNRCLTAIAGNMAIPNLNRLAGMVGGTGDFLVPDLPAGIGLIARTFASALVTDNSYSKADVKEFLREKSKVPHEQIVLWDGKSMMKEAGLWKAGDMVPATPKPEQINLAIVGGDQGGHGFWMAPAIFGLETSVEVGLLSNWDDLLYEAEIDPGPLPATN